MRLLARADEVIMRRRDLVALLGAGFIAPPAAVRAQQRDKVHMILWVSTEAQPDPFIAGFREGMRELGYVEGHNLGFVLRYAPGDPAAVQAMLPELLATPGRPDRVERPCDPGDEGGDRPPILFAISGDPVELGLAESLARPGRNFTGSTFLSLEVAQKRVQVLRELLPGMRTLAVLSNTRHPGEQSERQATEEAAKVLSVRVA